MDYKEYLLKQSAINLQYIAEKMWPTNKNAKSYLSTKLNGTDSKRKWTDSDNLKAQQAINNLGMQLIKDTENKAVEHTKKASVKKDKPLVKSIAEKKVNIWDEMEKLRNEKPGATKQ